MSLSMGKTEMLRKAWGDKPCEHPNITKERGFMGQHTIMLAQYVELCFSVGKTLQEKGAEGKKLMEK